MIETGVRLREGKFLLFHSHTPSGTPADLGHLSHPLQRQDPINPLCQPHPSSMSFLSFQTMYLFGTTRFQLQHVRTSIFISACGIFSCSMQIYLLDQALNLGSLHWER